MFHVFHIQVLVCEQMLMGPIVIFINDIKELTNQRRVTGQL
ncbi:hypothetical protein VIBR0546_18101 [Vibrio brasiliensis LMG 20546]|uniref:Uncharacterized protein n=1 Tax=Vibrio brasiliensis LMG 20546 TaxID=945543 RepID=E8LPT5_9VIBR|nr:hypothetical protein VIBR0546_18101 [Vibrio brasiliensis LMG 20546]